MEAAMSVEPRPIVYRICRFVLQLWLRLCFGYQTRGAHQVPRTGGCILASNHASFLDPPLVGCDLDYRFVRFLARDTLFHNPLFRWWARRVGVVMLDRTKGDIAALKAALGVLRADGVLCLFPEGTRTRDGRLQAAKGGIGFLIAKACVPVFPVYVEGSFKAWPRRRRSHKICVHFGAPLQPADWQSYAAAPRADYQQIANMVMQRIAALESAQKNT